MNYYFSQPDTGEQALEIVEALVRSGAVDIIVIDSVAALVPKAEIEGEMGDSHMGLQARLCRKHFVSFQGLLISLIQLRFSLTRFVRKSVLCSEIRKQLPGGRALKILLFCKT